MKCGGCMDTPKLRVKQLLSATKKMTSVHPNVLVTV